MELNQQLVDQTAILKVKCLEYGMLSLFFILNKNVGFFNLLIRSSQNLIFIVIIEFFMEILRCYSLWLVLASNKNEIEFVQSTPMLFEGVNGQLALTRVRTQNEKVVIETVV